jgi:predicted ABC-type sugar transport system permease subunit
MGKLLLGSAGSVVCAFILGAGVFSLVPEPTPIPVGIAMFVGVAFGVCVGLWLWGMSEVEDRP